MAKFYMEPSPNGYYLLKLDTTGIPNFYIRGGTCAFIQSGLLNISLANYCRLCRDEYGAQLKNKEGWPVIIWKYEKDAVQLIRLLNKQLDLYLQNIRN